MTVLQHERTSAVLTAEPRADVVASRRTAVIVAFLFLTATVTFMIADSLVGGVLNAPNYLATASHHAGALTAGALLACVEGPATLGIAVALYPILKRTNEPLALAFVAFRVAEMAAALLYVVTALMVVKVGDGVRNGTVDGAAVHRLSPLFQDLRSLSIVLMYLITSIGGAILAALLYRSGIVPRRITVLGVVGYPVLLIGSALALFGVLDVNHGAGMLVVVPGGLFELALPLWLLVKGFRRVSA